MLQDQALKCSNEDAQSFTFSPLSDQKLIDWRMREQEKVSVLVFQEAAKVAGSLVRARFPIWPPASSPATSVFLPACLSHLCVAVLPFPDGSFSPTFPDCILWVCTGVLCTQSMFMQLTLIHAVNLDQANHFWPDLTP